MHKAFIVLGLAVKGVKCTQIYHYERRGCLGLEIVIAESLQP